MPDGRILIKSTGITLPVDMCFSFVAYTKSEYLVTASTRLYSTTSDATKVTRLNNYFYLDQNLTTPAGIFAMIQRKLNLKQ